MQEEEVVDTTTQELLHQQVQEVQVEVVQEIMVHLMELQQGFQELQAQEEAAVEAVELVQVSVQMGGQVALEL
tara:strand:- start:72 stop:290 length:219 start_codon:yes stop_codon:yes gene_type:complete